MKLKCIDSTTLKLIALISMTIDHTGLVLFPQHIWLRYVGRLAFPIYCFLIVEGYLHTKNVYKYMGRLALLALVSEIPFNLMLSGTVFFRFGQNVFFTLLIGLAALFFMNWLYGHLPKGIKFLSVGAVVAGCVIAYVIDCDYSYKGVLMIAFFYILRESVLYQLVGVGAVQLYMGGVQVFAIASFIPISLYNGEKGWGNKVFQWIFYFYYPVHLLVLCFLKLIMYR